MTLLSFPPDELVALSIEAVESLLHARELGGEDFEDAPEEIGLVFVLEEQDGEYLGGIEDLREVGVRGLFVGHHPSSHEDGVERPDGIGKRLPRHELLRCRLRAIGKRAGSVLRFVPLTPICQDDRGRNDMVAAALEQAR